jgi:bifunctional ADP-heptose synthase (sugar kinase/adenylyltransferase)
MTELKNTQAQKSLNVLLIGDSCIDEYKLGTVDRLSPEAPVPVTKIIETKTVPGMAANVKQNFENLGIYVDFITNSEVITKTRYIDGRSGQHLLRVDNEPEIAPWSGRTPFPIDRYDTVVISDYNKGFLTYQHIEQIIHNFQGPIFIDTKKTDLKRFQGAYVKINSLENSLATSVPDDLIVTLGKYGARYKDQTYPAPTIEVSDVCGAGDTFLSALTYQYLLTKDIEKAILFANIAASLTVQHRGNYAPTYDEIRIAGY